MTNPTKFTLPETHQAFLRWATITGLGWESPEWGEVWRVLDDCGLLDADRSPQRGLFDLPETKLGDTRRVVHLRVVIEVGAWLYQLDAVPDPATGTEIVAALLEHHYTQEADWSHTRLSVRLTVDIPGREFTVHDSPGEALLALLPADCTTVDNSLAWTAYAAATQSDAYASAVFERLETHDDWYRALVPLCSGRWLVFRCDT